MGFQGLMPWPWAECHGRKPNALAKCRRVGVGVGAGAGVAVEVGVGGCCVGVGIGVVAGVWVEVEVGGCFVRLGLGFRLDVGWGGVVEGLLCVRSWD